jgi:signal transduction histidine kinase
VPALEWLVRQMKDKYGLTVSLQVNGAVQCKDENVMVVLFRCVRELLFNVVKHAQTRAAAVTVAHKGDGIQILISDHGAGFVPGPVDASADPDGGFGLFSIRQRLELLGGHLLVESAPGQGSRFTLVAPLPDRQDEP